MDKQDKNNKVAEIEINQIFSVVMIISVTVVGTAYMLNVLGDVKTDMGEASCAARSDGFTTYATAQQQCYNGSDYTAVLGGDFNATSSGVTAVGKFPTKMGLVATIIVAVIIITLLTRYFRF